MKNAQIFLTLEHVPVSAFVEGAVGEGQNVCALHFDSALIWIMSWWNQNKKRNGSHQNLEKVKLLALLRVLLLNELVNELSHVHALRFWYKWLLAQDPILYINLKESAEVYIPAVPWAGRN